MRGTSACGGDSHKQWQRRGRVSRQSQCVNKWEQTLRPRCETPLRIAFPRRKAARRQIRRKRACNRNRLCVTEFARKRRKVCNETSPNIWQKAVENFVSWPETGCKTFRLGLQNGTYRKAKRPVSQPETAHIAKQRARNGTPTRRRAVCRTLFGALRSC